MAETTTVKTKTNSSRKRRNFAAEREKVITLCRISIDILNQIEAPGREYSIPAYEAVLKQMGEYGDSK